jgi:uncharacterized protein (TIGR02452 family)
VEKEELIQVFENTKNVCANIKAPISKKYNWDSFDLLNGHILVEPLDTVSALIKYAPIGKTLVLNMASSKRCGGGVEKGSIAQEECIFRCSNLFEISKELYPIEREEYIYSKDVTFIKDKDYNIMTPIICDVITIAAVNLNTIHVDGNDSLNKEMYRVTMYEKMHAIFKAAIENKCDNIILGAWGCGVFKNDPNEVVMCFNEVTINYKHYFKNIIFAVINDKNSVANNYQIFKDKIRITS